MSEQLELYILYSYTASFWQQTVCVTESGQHRGFAALCGSENIVTCLK